MIFQNLMLMPVFGRRYYYLCSTMAKEYFKHYVWLLQTLQSRGYCTYDELNDLWKRSNLNPDGKDISKRTLANHRESILDMFGIIISCDRRTNEYYIENKDDVCDGGLQEWMLGALSLGSMLHDDASLKGKVIFDNVPSSQKHLPIIIDALKRCTKVEFSYKNTEMTQPRSFLVAPYCVRLFRRRWYLLGLREGTTEPHLYALDRMIDVYSTEIEYDYPTDFSAEEYYRSYFGIDMPDGKAETIRLKASARQSNNLRALPLHNSQKEYEVTENGETTFEYYLVPSSTFIGEILMMQGSVEVLEPLHLREKIKSISGILYHKHK